MGEVDPGDRPSPETGLTKHPLDTLDDDIRDHVERETEANIERGMPPREARLAAWRRFGRVSAAREDARAVWTPGWLDHLHQDLRYAVRGIRRRPGFSAAAAAILALGIGVNTAVFSVADALVLRPLPVAAPGELRAVFSVLRIDGRALKSGTLVPYSLYADLRQHSDAFDGTMAFGELDDLSIDTDGGRHVGGSQVAFVSDNYFSVLGVTPRLGRTFYPGEDLEAGNSRAVLVSDRFWKWAFDADPAVLGRTIRVADHTFTVIGVLPPEFFGVVIGRSPSVYFPLGSLGLAQPGIVSAQNPDAWMVRVVGRMAKRVDDQTAADRLTVVMQAGFPVLKPVIELLPIETGFSDLRTRFRRPAQVLMLLVGTLLFISCVNVAVMLLARNLARQREIGTRLAIGASKARIARQFVTEGLVLAFIGASIGLALTPWATRVLVALLADAHNGFSLHVPLDTRVLAFTVGISVLSALISTAGPAIRVMAFAVAESIADRERSVSSARPAPGRVLVVAQIAMSLTMVCGAALLVRTLHNLSTLDPGFDPDRVALLEVTPGSRGYDDKRRAAYYSELLERLASMPGVQSVTASQLGLLDRDNRTTGTIDTPGSAALSDDERFVQVYLVGPRFFETLGIPVLSGRDFASSDMAGPRVAAINETASRRFFGETDPVGATINGSVRLLAVVGDSRYHELRDGPTPAMFVPYTQSRIRERMVFSVQTSGGDIAAALVHEARGLDALVPVRVTSLRAIKERSLSQERLLAVLAGVFAATALLLLAIALFGVVTFRVRQQTAEIGLRLALGARRGHVVWLMMRRPLTLAAAGVALGVPATLATTRLTTALLFGVTPTDLSTLIGASIGLLLIVLLSTAWPAWRATQLDPTAALRCE